MVCQIDIILHYITTLLSTNQCSSQVWSNGQADGPSLVLFHALSGIQVKISIKNYNLL